jgi:preprotein translocase subunit SecA
MERFKIPDDQPMEAKILSRQIEGAQKKVEEQNFVQRKNVLKYDDVLNRHRGRIYEQRTQVLAGEDMSDQVRLWIDEVVEDTVNLFTEEPYSGDWDLEALTNAMAALYETEITAAELREDLEEISRESLIEEFQSDARDEYTAKEDEFGAELMRELERFVILQVVDVRWREHLEHMDYLREGIGLRAMAQKDPLVEYTAEGERVFVELSRAIRGEVVLHLFHAELAPEQGGGGGVPAPAPAPAGNGGNGGAAAASTLGLSPVAVQTSEPHKVGRNDPCWCGSGKKFKKCHGA